MEQNISVLISSCDNFSDLWDAHIDLYRKNWNGNKWKTYLVTDKPTAKKYEDVDIIVAEENMDFPMRIKYALSKIETDYVLLTLDDYFLIKPAYEEKLRYLLKKAETDNIDYLMLYNRRKTNEKKYGPPEKLDEIKLDQKYAVTLYPAIWNKNFLAATVVSNCTTWEYEPSLTKRAREYNAKCMFSHSGAFDILDVVRKGKILHKANRYFKKNGIDIGNRPLISIWTEFKLFIMDIISWYMPRKLFVFCKKLLGKFGKTFYSEE